MIETRTDAVARARSLRSLVEAEAEEAEAAGTTTKPVVDAVTEQELFWTMVPEAAGGLEAPIAECLGVFEELAYADGSTGWSVMANATSSTFAALYCDDDAVRTMFPAGARGVHAGMFGPVGQAAEDDGGYRFSGNYRFGSGCRHATWIGAGAVETTRRRAGHHRLGTAVAARRFPPSRAGRAPRQLGRHGPRRHRQRRLRRDGRGRRRRIHVPVARGATVARRCDVPDRTVRSRRVGTRRVRARRRQARARRGPRHRRSQAADGQLRDR